MANETLVPQIRFSEFTGNWESNLLGEIALFSKGKGISKSEIDKDGEIECIRYGELYTEYSETISTVKSRTNVSREELVFSEANDVIIPASGETQIDIATASCILRDGIALGGDLNIIKSNTNGVFLSYYLNNRKKKDIAQLAQGISVVHLYASQLKELKLTLPESEEQTKIADFIAKVDSQIQLLEKEKALLEQYKKGISQKIFNQEIRFKDDNGNDFLDWEDNKLSNNSTFFSGGTPLTTIKEFYNGEIPFIKSGEINNVKTEQFISEAGLKNSSAKMVETGDLLYALYGATSGEVAISKINGAINQAVLCVRNNSFNNRFLLNYLQLNKTAIIEKYIQGGQGNLSADIVKKLVIPTPTIDEQNKIADFFFHLDSLIENTDIQISKSKSFKKGLLQKMFL